MPTVRRVIADLLARYQPDDVIGLLDDALPDAC